jgi:hypothetical protein
MKRKETITFLITKDLPKTEQVLIGIDALKQLKLLPFNWPHSLNFPSLEVDPKEPRTRLIPINRAAGQSSLRPVHLRGRTIPHGGQRVLQLRLPQQVQQNTVFGRGDKCPRNVVPAGGPCSPPPFRRRTSFPIGIQGVLQKQRDSTRVDFALLPPVEWPDRKIVRNRQSNHEENKSRGIESIRESEPSL